MITKNIIKITIILSLIFSTNCSFAENIEYYKKTMCPTTQTANGTIAKTLSQITGMNFLLTTLLEQQVKEQMDKALDADFDVKIIAFGGKSLIDGKFKTLEANAKSANIEGLYLSNVFAKSVCEYNHFIYENKEVYTNENFLLEFGTDITTEDLNKTVNSLEYTNLMQSLTVNVGGFTIFKVFNPKAEIKNNKLSYSLTIYSPIFKHKPKTFTITMGIYVEDEVVKFSEIEVNPALNNTNLNNLLPIINKLNPLTFKTTILKNSKSIIKIQDIHIIDNKISIKGLVIVPKNYYNN